MFVPVPRLTTHRKNRATWPSLSWLKCEVRENLRLPKIDSNFNISFLTTACSPIFQETNMLHNDLKKDAINEFGIKYWTSNPEWVKFQAPFMWTLKKKYDYWWKKYGLEKTDRATKTSTFWQKLGDFIEIKAKKSSPLRLVPSQDLDFIHHCSSSCLFSKLRWEVIVYFVDTSGIVDHHCLNFLFIIYVLWIDNPLMESMSLIYHPEMF
jgi:hypothetical protein